jgi:hypothetical protein
MYGVDQNTTLNLRLTSSLGLKLSISGTNVSTPEVYSVEDTGFFGDSRWYNVISMVQNNTLLLFVDGVLIQSASFTLAHRLSSHLYHSG